MSTEIFGNLASAGKRNHSWFEDYILLAGQLVAGMLAYDQLPSREHSPGIPESATSIASFFRYLSDHCSESRCKAFIFNKNRVSEIPEDELNKLVTTLSRAHNQKLLKYQDIAETLLELLAGSKHHPVCIPEELSELMLKLTGSEGDSIYCPFSHSFTQGGSPKST